MKCRKKISLGVIGVLVIMAIAALLTGTGLAADLTGEVKISGAPATAFIGGVVYLNTAGQSAPMSAALAYTIDPYLDPAKPGYYEFLQLTPGSYIVTPDVPGYMFTIPSMYVRIDSQGRIAQVNGTVYDYNLQPPPVPPSSFDFTSVMPPVNGACGSSNGQTLASAPTGNLCSAGTASAVSGSGPWTWTCAGLYSGSTANCTAYKQGVLVNGACGSSNGQTLASAPTTNLCSAGTASAVSGSGPWTWTCAGVNGGASPSCTAYKQTTNPGDPIVIAQNDEEAVTLAAKQTKSFKFTTPAGGCARYVKITMINVSLTGGDGQLLVKTSNHGASTSVPTVADYNYEFGLHGYSMGQDWTRDPNGGVFFWKWAIGAASEILGVMPSYTGHTFSNDDTYYLLLYNQGTTSNDYRVLWQCL